jgi:hypothetical protein
MKTVKNPPSTKKTHLHLPYISIWMNGMPWCIKHGVHPCGGRTQSNAFPMAYNSNWSMFTSATGKSMTDKEKSGSKTLLERQFYFVKEHLRTL